MLPYLDKITIKNFLPIISTNIQVQEKNLSYQAGHGEGKTTLCALIAFSLLRESVHSRRKAYFHSRITNKDSQHIIESVWKFTDDDKFNVKHKITKKMMFIEKDNQSIDLKTYDKFILDKTRLNLDELGFLFRFLYQLNELDHHPFFTEKSFHTAILDILKRVLVDEKANKKISSLKGDRVILKDNIKQKKDEIYDLLQSSHLLEKFPDRQRALDTKENELGEIQTKIDSYILELDDAKNEEEEVIKSINTLRSEKNQLKIDKKGITESIKILEREKRKVDSSLNTYHNFYESVIDDIKSDPLCRFCGNSILDNWSRENDGSCPLCGLELSQHLLSSDKREKVSELRKKELTKRKDEIIQDISEKRLKCNQLTEKIEQIEKKIKKKDKERKDFRSIQQLNNRAIQEESERLGRAKKVLELIKSYLSVDVEEKYQIFDEELNKLDGNLEKIEKELKSLEQETDFLTDFMDAVEVKWEELYRKYLGEKVAINLRERSITYENQKRYLENISGAESHISSFLLKIALWDKLIKFGKAKQGLIIIDSPIVYSNRSIDRLWEIINTENSTNICYIVTVPNDIKIKGDYQKIGISMNKTLDAFFPKL